MPVAPLRFVFGDWSGGAGAVKAAPGRYQIATNWDGRFNVPGPREVPDLTGIAAGFRVVQILRHADTPVAIATDGTDTKVYRIETTWVLKATIAGRVAVGWGAVSFKSVLAIPFGSGNAYQFTTGTGAGAWTFTASTKTSGNSKNANYFLQQTSGVANPRVIYATNPNEIYYTEDLTNGDGAGVNPTYVLDNATTQQYFTSIAEEPGSGRALFGMRRALWALSTTPGYEGIPQRLTEDFNDSPNDAGGQSDRLNFEGPVMLGGRLYYPVEGYDLLEWDGSGNYNRYRAPRWLNSSLPRLSLPINCLATAGGWLLCFLGSKNTGSLKDVTYFPGGNAHLAGQFTTNSELWVGHYEGDTFVWHGVLLTVGNPLRFAWWNEDDTYLYLASGDSEAINVQMTRCLFAVDNPAQHLYGGALTLSTATWKMELGPIDFGDEWEWKRAEHIRLELLGSQGVGVADVEVEYKLTSGYDTGAFQSEFINFASDQEAEQGVEFPSDSRFRVMHLRFLGATDGGGFYVRLGGGELRAVVDEGNFPKVRR